MFILPLLISIVTLPFTLLVLVLHQAPKARRNNRRHISPGPARTTRHRNLQLLADHAHALTGHNPPDSPTGTLSAGTIQKNERL